MERGKILVAEHQGAWVVKMIGDVRMNLCTTIESCLNQMFSDAEFKSVVIDLTETQGIDSTSLGLLAKLSMKTQDRLGVVPTLISTNDDVTRILLSMGFKDKVFIIVSDYPAPDSEGLAELPEQACSEQSAKERVLEAHRILMDLNENNRDQFKDLVCALETGSC